MGGRKAGRGEQAGQRKEGALHTLRSTKSHSQLSGDYRLFKTGLSRVLLSLCDIFVFPKPAPYHVCPIPSWLLAPQ